jgi:5'-deoxynucleotidase YfbR-like HD superfamily hydrolase
MRAPTIDRIAALATYRYLPRLAKATAKWKQFEYPSDRCGTLARDFDKLDAVFQAFAYVDRFPTAENRREFIADCKDQIISPSLREIAEEIFKRATQRAN